jgi:hypothetical protein
MAQIAPFGGWRAIAKSRCSAISDAALSPLEVLLQRWRLMNGELEAIQIKATLRGEIKQAGDEAGLASDVASADVPNLPFPDHRHRFETSQCSSSRPEAAKAEPPAS